jgi:hydrogenase-4 component E
MQFAHLPPLAASLFSLLATVSLLFSFGMLGSRWISNYLYAFSGESLTIATLSAVVGFYGGYPELYLIAVLTALFRGCVLPYLIWQIVRGTKINREIHIVLQPSTSLVLGAFSVVFALLIGVRIGAQMGLSQTIIILALTVMLSMKMIGLAVAVSKCANAKHRRWIRRDNALFRLLDLRA